MAKIVIMDDNRSTGNLLKKALEYDDHQVELVDTWQALGCKTVHPLIDLVLIHRNHQKNSGWRAFNQFKRINHHIPAMLYVLPDFRPVSMAWVVKAVREALLPMKKSDGSISQWTMRSDSNYMQLDH